MAAFQDGVTILCSLFKDSWKQFTAGNFMNSLLLVLQKIENAIFATQKNAQIVKVDEVSDGELRFTSLLRCSNGK